MAATVVVNGVSITTSGSISISNGKIMVDGKEVNTEDAKVIHIEVNGDIRDLKVDVCADLKIKGNVDRVNTSSASVEIEGYVAGNVQTMSGSVDVTGSVGGDVSTMSGNIRHRKG